MVAGGIFLHFWHKEREIPDWGFRMLCAIRFLRAEHPDTMHRYSGRVGQEGNGHSALSVGEIDRETPVAHSVFIHILKQNPGLHNKQSGKFTCIFRMDWQKMIKLAKMALQILTKSIYNGDRNDVYTRSKR